MIGAPSQDPVRPQEESLEAEEASPCANDELKMRSSSKVKWLDITKGTYAYDNDSEGSDTQGDIQSDRCFGLGAARHENHAWDTHVIMHVTHVIQSSCCSGTRGCL